MVKLFALFLCNEPSNDAFHESFVEGFPGEPAPVEERRDNSGHEIVGILPWSQLAPFFRTFSDGEEWDHKTSMKIGMEQGYFRITLAASIIEGRTAAQDIR